MSDESEAPSQETASFSHNFHFLSIYQKWYLLSVELNFFQIFRVPKIEFLSVFVSGGTGLPFPFFPLKTEKESIPEAL